MFEFTPLEPPKYMIVRGVVGVPECMEYRDILCSTLSLATSSTMWLVSGSKIGLGTRVGDGVGGVGAAGAKFSLVI